MKHQPNNDPNSQPEQEITLATMPQIPVFSIENYAKLAADLAAGTATPEQIKESFYASCLDNWNLSQSIEIAIDDLRVRQTLTALGVTDANEHTHEQNVERLVDMIHDSHALHFVLKDRFYTTADTARSWIVDNLTQQHIDDFPQSKYEMTPEIQTRLDTFKAVSALIEKPIHA